jgi:CheY-like chemotaxis protein
MADPVVRDLASLPSAPNEPSRSNVVLLVDDNDGVRLLVCELLRRLGYGVIDASSGWDALGLLHSYDGTIDLLVTDIVLPDMSGLEVADRIRDRWPAAKVLYTSGYADDSIMMPGVVVPAAAFLQKPYSFAALSRAVYDLAPLHR